MSGLRTFVLKIAAPLAAFFVGTIALLASAFADEEASSAAPALRVADGFEVTLFADDPLAHDIFSLTVDAKGRVVVSGPGYVRILQDKDGDGRAESFTQFADGPATGAQGLCFLGNDLLCTGDAGLLRYKDRDEDDRADGPPDVFLKLKTGNEHHVHAIQKGPDGWFYLIAGNMSGITSAFATLPTSPVRKVEAGAVLRFTSDLSRGEIVCDGLRNAYDFAFHGQGDLFTYDSDGEREVTLPWYRPTRVFHLAPGSHAGWITESFKWPNGFPEMPATLAELGRGSPTGVVCCRHRQFPPAYQGAILAADWTYGRVMALPLKADGSGWTSEPVPFLTAVDQFGFAPTDMEFGPDGSLYVSTGGRGTRGAVFRIRSTRRNPPPPARIQLEYDRLTDCLDADQPLSSWSRAQWEPVARGQGREKVLEVAIDETEPEARRVRAIEVLVDLFGGVDAELLRKFASSESPAVRARAVWAWGRSTGEEAVVRDIAPFLRDPAPTVRRTAFEAMFRLTTEESLAAAVPFLVAGCGDSDAGARGAAMRLGSRFPASQREAVLAAARAESPLASIAAAVALAQRPSTVNVEVLAAALEGLEGDLSPQGKSLAARLLQLGLGDIGPSGKRPALFDGYTARVDLLPFERDLDPVRTRLAKQFPTGDEALDWELGRVIAALAPYNGELLNRVLGKLSEDSHPTGDIHWLVVASRMAVDRTSAQRAVLAKAFVGLEDKIARRKLPQDTDWIPRLTELYRAHVSIDAHLPAAVISEPQFGAPGHAIYLNGLPKDQHEAALQRFIDRARETPESPVTADLIFALGDSPNAAHREFIRSQYERFAVRPAVTLSLSSRPEEQDREKYLDALDSSQIEVLTAAVEALRKLPPDRSGATQFALFRTARRLGNDPRERAARESIARLLEHNTDEPVVYPSGNAEISRQNAAWDAWERTLRRLYPEEAELQRKQAAVPTASLNALLNDVDWSAGDVARGRLVFEKRQCSQCHGGVRAVGPDLAGVTRRFSRVDLLTAILDPDRDVSPRYQTTLIQTAAGKVHTGLVIYQSVDGLLLRTATNQTLRIETSDIDDRKTLRQSLMPQGLLKEAPLPEYADLIAYLSSLSPPAP